MTAIGSGHTPCGNRKLLVVATGLDPMAIEQIWSVEIRIYAVAALNGDDWAEVLLSGTGSCCRIPGALGTWVPSRTMVSENSQM